MAIPFTCATCGDRHEGFPALVFDGPAPWDWSSADERAADWRLSSDLGQFRDEDFYVRCVLELPIVGSDDVLEFGVWSTLSRENFDRYRAAFDDEDQSKLGPMFGWFANAVPGYPDSFALKCNVLPQDRRRRPLIKLEPTDHPLAVAQRMGITRQDAARYFHAHMAMD